MILRKPYAILIKNFRRIHILMSLMILYLLYKTSNISSFFGKYILDASKLVDPSITSTLNSIWIYIIPIFVIVISIIIITLLSVKKKPITFYFFNIITCIVSLVVYTYVGSILIKLEVNLVDIRDLKLAHDFTRSLLFLQGISVLVTIARATGFNVRKFDFNRDLAELQIEETDREEFEVNLEVEEGKFKRDWNRFKRYTKYVFLENRFLLGIVFIFVIGLTVLFIILNATVFNKVYKKGNFVSASDLIFKVNEIYITDLNHRGKQISDKYSYIVANVDMRNIMATNFELESSKFYFQIQDHYFYPSEKFNKYLFDFGDIYKKKNINSEFENYSFVFEIPKGFKDDKKVFGYMDSTGKKYKLSTKFVDVDKQNENKEYKLGEKVVFDNTPLSKTELILQKVEVNDMFRSDYSFCVNDKCNSSYEYILPEYTDNYDKGILKIEGNLLLDKTVNSTYVYNLYTFIKNFGKLKYSVDGVEKEIFLSYNQIKPTKTKSDTVIYMEIPLEVTRADHLTLLLYIRGHIYQYSVK